MPTLTELWAQDQARGLRAARKASPYGQATSDATEQRRTQERYDQAKLNKSYPSGGYVTKTVKGSTPLPKDFFKRETPAESASRIAAGRVERAAFFTAHIPAAERTPVIVTPKVGTVGQQSQHQRASGAGGELPATSAIKPGDRVFIRPSFKDAPNENRTIEYRAASAVEKGRLDIRAITKDRIQPTQTVIAKMVRKAPARLQGGGVVGDKPGHPFRGNQYT